MAQIQYFQEQIDQTIRELGGYWRPLSSLARLLEELGEVHEVVKKQEINKRELAAELSDLYIISTCLANQYCTDLEEEYERLGYPAESAALIQHVSVKEKDRQAFLELTPLAGKMARILNHYEGDKKKKPTEQKQRLGEEVAQFHMCLIRLGKSWGIDLFQVIEQILQRNMIRDKGRFDSTHDPSTERSRKHFLQILKNKGQFKSQKIWGGHPWDPKQDVQSNLIRHIPIVQRFLKCALHEGLVGFVIEVEDDRLSSDAKRIELGVTILHSFVQLFPEVHIKGEGEEWKQAIGVGKPLPLTLQEQQLQWMCFSNHYPTGHSLHIGEPDRLFIYFELDQN